MVTPLGQLCLLRKWHTLFTWVIRSSFTTAQHCPNEVILAMLTIMQWYKHFIRVYESEINQQCCFLAWTRFCTTCTGFSVLWPSVPGWLWANLTRVSLILCVSGQLTANLSSLHLWDPFLKGTTEEDFWPFSVIYLTLGLLVTGLDRKVQEVVPQPPFLQAQQTWSPQLLFTRHPCQPLNGKHSNYSTLSWISLWKIIKKKKIADTIINDSLEDKLWRPGRPSSNWNYIWCVATFLQASNFKEV